MGDHPETYDKPQLQNGEMSVNELIKLLSNLPPDQRHLPVRFWTTDYEDFGQFDVAGVEIEQDDCNYQRRVVILRKR